MPAAMRAETAQSPALPPFYVARSLPGVKRRRGTTPGNLNCSGNAAMSIETGFYRDLAYVFGAAVIGGYAAKALRQPLIVGYVVGGILIGPFTPGPAVSEIRQFELLAEVGVILLMYSIGLEFSFRELWQVKKVAVLGGPLGIVLSIGLALLAGRGMGWSATQSIAVGAVISVASTMVLSRILIDRGELRSPHGRIMIGI